MARTGFLLGVLSLATIGALQLRGRTRRRIAWVVIPLVAVGLAAFLVNVAVSEGQHPWLKNFATIAAPGEAGNAERFGAMGRGWKALQSLPWNGRGLAAARARFPEVSAVNCENTWLTLVHTLGVPGLAFTALWLGGSAWAARRCWRRAVRDGDRAAKAALVFALPLLPYTMLSPCLWLWGQGFVLWCAGLLLAMAAAAPDEGGTNVAAADGAE